MTTDLYSVLLLLGMYHLYTTHVTHVPRYLCSQNYIGMHMPAMYVECHIWSLENRDVTILFLALLPKQYQTQSNWS